MATLGVATTSDALLGISSDFVRPDFHQVPLDLESWLQSEKKLRLSTDSQLCQLSLLPPGCPLGSACPLRHVENLPPKEAQKNSDIVCRHWLRGMCKLVSAVLERRCRRILTKMKGPIECPFLHVWNLRAMSNCYLYTTFKRCEIGYVDPLLSLVLLLTFPTDQNAYISTSVTKIEWEIVRITAEASALVAHTVRRIMSDRLCVPRIWLDTAQMARTANTNSESPLLESAQRAADRPSLQSFTQPPATARLRHSTHT